MLTNKTSLLNGYKIFEKAYVDYNDFVYYRAFRRLDNKLVIIKTTDIRSYRPEAVTSLKAEYALVQQLDLPIVLDVQNIEKEHKTIALIFEHFEGQFLEDYIATKPAIADILTIAIKLVEIIQQLHQKRIIHRNFNTSSLIINPRSLELKITNFSIAISFSDKKSICNSQIAAADIAYISPEQTGRVSHILDYRSDFYSLGVVLYKMLTGKLPFEATESLQLIHSHLAKTPVAPHQLDKSICPAISAIVMKLLAKSPDDRYQTAYALKADLEICRTQYQNQGTIELFDLGTLDSRSHLTISSKLYGRVAEIESFKRSAEKAYSGMTELVLVSGQSGLGKTSLIEQTIEPIVKHKGILIQGRFEPATVNIPYQGIRKAFNRAIQQLLTRGTNLLQYWRAKILSAVGNNGKVITNILPELELIIGSQPKIPALPAKETENRFNNVFLDFIKVLIAEEHPLVLFFDDLQWADSASLNLLGLIVNNLKDHYLLIVWAYQDHAEKHVLSSRSHVFSDYVDFTSLLTHTVKDSPSRIAINKIALQPLTIDHVNQLLVDSLQCEKSQSWKLAQLIVKRTKGNPFFVHQFIKNIYEENLLCFDFQEFNWLWKIEEIETISIIDSNILELIGIDFKKLEEESQQVLKAAACIGNQFDLQILADLCNESSKTIAQLLQPAEKIGILFLVQEESKILYKFAHNRIQQTAYSLIEATQKAHIHLKIGGLLLKQAGSSRESIDAKIFNLVSHFNIGKELITKNSAKYRVAELNLTASKKAKNAIAYEVAAHYLKTALELLPSSAWKDNYDLIFNVYLETIEVQYLLTNFKIAEHLANIAFNLAKTALEKAAICEVKIHSYIARNEMKSAIDSGLQVLYLLGKSLPEQRSLDDSITVGFDRENLLQDLENLPEMTDEHSLAAIKIMMILIPPAYIVEPPLFLSLVSQMVNLCLQDGNSRFSSYVYVTYGLVLCSVGDIDTGYKFGQLALKIQQKYETREIASKVNFVFNNMIRHWREPAINTINPLLSGIENSLEIGDFEYACFNAKYYCTYLFFVGESLASVAEKSQQQISLIKHLKQDFQLNYARIWQQLNLNLRGLTENSTLLIGKDFNEFKMVSSWQKSNNGTSLFAFYLAKLILCYFCQDYAQAVANAQQAKQYQEAAVGTMCFSMYYFYASLAMSAMCAAQADLKSAYLPQINAHHNQLKEWANYAPQNYLNKYYLVTAEIAKISGDQETAAENYDLAIATAAKAGYAHEASLAEELTAKFYLSLGRERIAEYYLTDAYYGYERWGAIVKVRVLQSEYAKFLTQIPLSESDKLTATEPQAKVKDTPTQNGSLSALDLLSVVKASQALSEEIILDNLLSKMMEIVMENAGAQKTVLLLNQDSSWVIAALATVAPAIEVQLPQISVTDSPELPNSIFNYVQSTRKTVILEQASKDSIFVNDPYITENQPKSVLACPMIYKEELQGIVYLENNLVKGAFNQQTIDILKVLLSQVSISIENARLYQNLQDHASVKKSLKQKEVLLKEIHHRVKNNLLVVSSLLEFQSSYIKDAKMIKILENCQNRITSMALVHQHLYGHNELNKINFAQYIEALLDNITHSQATAERNINLHLDLDEIELNIETANPCGLIINELVSNSLEHGFCDRDSGNVWLSLKRDSDEQIFLTIKDDGVGFGEDVDLCNSNSLGLELVCTLVDQIEGKIELDKNQGTTIEIVFCELSYKRRI